LASKYPSLMFILDLVELGNFLTSILETSPLMP